MKRRIGVFVASSLVTSFLAIGMSTAPATAKLCAGQGVAHLSKKIGFPIIGAQNNVLFTLSAKCTVGGGTANASGSIGTAACGRSTKGKGTVNGKAFQFQTLATMGIITGKVQGVFNAVSDVRKGDSCASKTADDFLVTSVINGL